MPNIDITEPRGHDEMHARVRAVGIVPGKIEVTPRADALPKQRDLDGGPERKR